MCLQTTWGDFVQFKACIVQPFLLRSADSCVCLWTVGSLGAVGLVAEEQFVEDHKNKAMLLGVYPETR